MLKSEKFFGKRDSVTETKTSSPVPAAITPAEKPATPGLTVASSASSSASSSPVARVVPASIAHATGASATTGVGNAEMRSKLTVGPNIKLKGVEITDCDTLVVEGTVEAAMDSRVIQIAERGVFKGTVSIDIAEIHGRFDGELTAREQLIVHASGKLSGKIRYGRIKIEEGGELCGDIARTDAAKPQRSAATLLKPAGTGD